MSRECVCGAHLPQFHVGKQCASCVLAFGERLCVGCGAVASTDFEGDDYCQGCYDKLPEQDDDYVGLL